MVAEIIINSNARALNKIFDYIVPKELEKQIQLGNRIFVPFGAGNKLEEGYVIGLKENSELAKKEIARIEDNILTKSNVELAKLMSLKYFCNISDCIRLMLPPGSSTKKIEKRVKDKVENFVYLAKSGEEIEFDIQNNIVKSPKHIKLLKFLCQNDGVSVSDLELITEVSKSIMKTVEKNGYINIISEKVDRNPFKHKKIKRDSKLELNFDQKKCYEKVETVLLNNQFDEFLIHGVTGAGKTEIYLQLIEKTLELGKTAVVLVPEISLTPQMVDRFLARFGDCIAVLHSKLSIGERYDEWYRIKNHKAKIVIGARSAIFAPVENLGIIIIDEEHDASYKSDMTPRYDARDLARYIAKKNDIPLVLGSATPDVGDYYKAMEEEKKLLVLDKRANNASLPQIEIVDLRYELAKGNKSMISTRLHEEIEKNLKRKKQTILFLNRRGYSTFIMCRDCGHTMKCKNCNISLTYHMFENKLKCHYCGYEEKPVLTCPICNSNRIRYFGSGTQKLEDEIHKLFPEATTIRMDIDTVNKKNSHEEILNKFKNENIDILIGTQMVVKGHHFPNVTLVGVIAADSSLNSSGYKGSERTYQTITQVAGRAGREKDKGLVIVQTYNPENYSITCAKDQDYTRFYETEIELRKRLNYPPFCDIICIKIDSENEQEVQKVSNLLYKSLKKENVKYMNVFKPVPAPIDKIKNTYRWRIILKCRLNKAVVHIINNSMNDFYKSKYKKTNVIVDVNPNNMN